MLDFVRFWLVVQGFALLALPLGWRLFAHLPDRGWTLSKPLGLLGSGYILWLLTSFGVLRNTAGGVLLAALVFAALGLWLGRAGWLRDAGGSVPLLAMIRHRWRYIVGVELLFLLSMAAWAMFRAYNPDIAGTEKPMEFAFLNGILNSRQFPPQDPWLAGFGISYYYFGYVLLSNLVLISGVSAGVAFNLGLAAIFALTLVAAFGLGYNLVVADRDFPVSGRRAAIFGALSALFVGIMGNLEGVLESLQARGLLTPTLHAFFDIKNLETASVTGSWVPNDFWWWWRASRTLHDYNITRTFDQEVIDEFPFFSFLLGDMHPHVLALPFALLVIALALNLYLRPHPVSEKDQTANETSWRDRLRGAWHTVVSYFGLQGWGLPIYGLALGALGFLNTWDFPIYLFLITLIYAFKRGQAGLQVGTRLWLEIGTVFLSLAGIGFLGFLPFYLGFSSQASGLLPNVYNPTRFIQYFLMFGPFLIALVLVLVVTYRQHGVRWRAFLAWLAAIWLIPAVFLAVSLLASRYLPPLRQIAQESLGLASVELVSTVLTLRITTLGTWLVVGLLLTLIATLASRVWQRTELELPRILVFMLALFFTALLLTYGVEFIYLRDTFGTRMNTVFKFYYQGWIMMSIGSAYALYYISRRGTLAFRIPAFILMTFLILGGMLYPTFAIPSKANNFQGDPTLDGTRFVALYRSDEAAVIDWLRQNTPGHSIIVEAPGGSYSDYNTISAHSGRATLLGWGGHELQWRGDYVEAGRREPLIAEIYQNEDPGRVREIVSEFGIDYMVVGPREISKYGIAPNRQRAFLNLWEPVFEEGAYVLYQWRG